MWKRLDQFKDFADAFLAYFENTSALKWPARTTEDEREHHEATMRSTPESRDAYVSVRFCNEMLTTVTREAKFSGNIPLLRRIEDRVDATCYVIFVVKPFRLYKGVAMLAARARYFLEPKWRRVRFEILRRLGARTRF